VILVRARAYPFGCFSDREVTFSPGLNVVLGPNEAGKSTLFRAIRHALLVSTKLGKKGLAEYVEPYLPVSGGDSVRTEVELLTPEGRWVLRRRWGSSPSSELLLPGGGSIAEEAAVIQRLRQILPAPDGAVAHILMTAQSVLSQTAEILEREAREPLADLADILRRAVLSAGGVSVDRFLARLAGDRQTAWSRWDRERGAPEAGRGIEKRWKKEVGTVLAGWYAREDARAAHRAAVEYEAGMDDVNARLRAAESAREKRAFFVSVNAKAAHDAGERRTLEARLQTARMGAESLARVSEQWPVALDRESRLAEEEARAQAARPALDRELIAAQRAEDSRALREKLAAVRRREARAGEAAAALGALPVLDRRGLEEIRTAAFELSRQEAGLQAGKISVTVAARATLDLVAQQDFEPEARATLAPGQVHRLTAGGRVRIVHREMEIEVRSGDADADSREGRVAQASRVLGELLSRHRVQDLAAAEERARVYEAAASDARAAQKSLDEELAGETRANLESRVTALGSLQDGRPLAEVSAEIASLKARADARDRERGELRRRISEWESAHGTRDRLLAGLASAKGQEVDLAAAIGRSAALPDGFPDTDEFLRAYEKARADLAECAAEVGHLRGRKEELDKGAPPLSAEEIALQVKDAEDAFDSELRRAQALDRLHAHSEELLGADESSVYSGLRERLEESVAAMTLGRHRGVEMDGSLPRGLTDATGGTVAWEWLSAGTKDSLALALRLAMASCFLDQQDGFLLMDDPLVDMDPDRQAAAAAALKSFADRVQVIVFTCHPSTAGLLGGNCITL
jgi:exonuclease SbcC